jgi:hypothetical protein
MSLNSSQNIHRTIKHTRSGSGLTVKLLGRIVAPIWCHSVPLDADLRRCGGGLGQMASDKRGETERLLLSQGETELLLARSSRRRRSPSGSGDGGWKEHEQPRIDRKKTDQTACKPGSVPPAEASAAIIPLDRSLRAGSRDLPGRLGPATALPEESPARRPYSVLLLAGLAVPPLSPETRCALTAPFHPYLRPKAKAVCFLWRYPWGRPRRALPAAMSSWSPDFPRAFARDRPAVWSAPKVVSERVRVNRARRPSTPPADGPPAPRPPSPAPPPACSARA